MTNQFPTRLAFLYAIGFGIKHTRLVNHNTRILTNKTQISLVQCGIFIVMEKIDSYNVVCTMDSHDH